MTLLRQKSIHPSYQTEEKQVTKPNTEEKPTGKLHQAKGTSKENVGEITNDPERKLTAKRNNAGKAQNRIGKLKKPCQGIGESTSSSKTRGGTRQ